MTAGDYIDRMIAEAQQIANSPEHHARFHELRIEINMALQAQQARPPAA